MNHSNWYKFFLNSSAYLTTIFLLLASLSSAQSIGFNQKPAASPSGKESFGPEFPCDQVLISARAPNQNLVVGEPLIIQFQIKGNVKRISTQHEANLQVGDDIEIWIKAPRGPAYKYKPPFQSRFGVGNVFRLQLQETIEKSILIGYDPETIQGSLFDIAGEYRVYVRFFCKQSQGFLNLAEIPINVTVGDENPDASLARNTLAYNPENFLSIQALSIYDESHRVPIEKVYNQAKTSKLWPYAAFILAQDKRASNEPAQMREAVKIYREINNNYSGHFLQYFAATKLVQTLFDLGEDEKALNAFFENYQDPILARQILKGDPNYQRIFAEKPEFKNYEWFVFEEAKDGWVDQEKELEEYRAKIVKAGLHKEKQIEIIIWNEFDVE